MHRALCDRAGKAAKARGECRCATAIHTMGGWLACIPPGSRFAAHTVPQEGKEPGICSQRLVAQLCFYSALQDRGTGGHTVCVSYAETASCILLCTSVNCRIAITCCFDASSISQHRNRFLYMNSCSKLRKLDGWTRYRQAY